MKETHRYSFRLKPGRDDDLIGRLESMGDGERSVFIRQALRSAWGGQGAPIPPQPNHLNPPAAPKEPITWQPFPETETHDAKNELNERLDKLTSMF